MSYNTSSALTSLANTARYLKSAASRARMGRRRGEDLDKVVVDLATQVSTFAEQVVRVTKAIDRDLSSLERKTTPRRG